MHRVDELIELFGLARFADNLVSELSTGSRRLVDLAAVVAHQPRVVLLDEPSSGVAQREVEAMVELLRTVRERLDATLLVVEHDIAFIAELADRLVAMDRGTVHGQRRARRGPRVARGGGGVLRVGPAGPTRSGPDRDERNRHDHGGGPRMSDIDAEPRPSERPWPRVSRLRVVGPGRPHRGRPGRRRRLGHRPREQQQRQLHDERRRGGSTGTGGQPSTQARPCPSPTPRPPSWARRTSIDWGTECDHKSGRLKMPSVYSPPCVPVFTGANGGATSGGVTGNTINVVYYQAQPGGLASAVIGRGRHQRPGPCHRPGLRGHVQPGVRAVRAAREPRSPSPPRGPTPIRWRPTPTPSPWRSSSTPSRPSTARRRRPPTRTSWRAEHVLCMACGDSHLYGEIQQQRPLPVGQPAHGRHVAVRDHRLRRRQAEPQGRRLGRRPLLPHPAPHVHHRERDLGAARAGRRPSSTRR